MAQLLNILVIFCLIGASLQDINNNEIDDTNPFVEAAQNLFQGNNGADIGSMIGNFISSEGGKQMMGQLLMGKNGGGSAAADILQGIGSMMGQGGGGGGGFDASMIGNILGMLNTDHSHNSDGNSVKENSGLGGFDFSSAIALANSFVNQDGSNEFMNYLPSLLEIFSSLYDERKAHDHAGHAWFLPPIIEKLHIVFDTFINSELGRGMVKKVGAEKFIRIFSDDQGNFSYKKFVELLENHSFRKHWIRMVTARIAEGLAYVADPYTQKKYLMTAQFFVNNFLKSQGFPKKALFDPTRPTESITELVNYIPMKFLRLKVDASTYIVPAVEYGMDIVRMAENKGILGRAIDSNDLTHKLTDTINLEIIEPVARVNRAVRFAKKVPKCTQYVLCIANQVEDVTLSLPGLKKSLSKGATLVASWYISGYANIPFWTLFDITSKGTDCQGTYVDECNDFHVEEIKVTTEYVHNEL